MEDKQEIQENKTWDEELLINVEKQISEVIEENINTDNITYLGKLVDIHKDIKNENYWKEKIKMYRDRDYYGDHSYGRTGRYMENSYGRQGEKGTGSYSKYRGDDKLDEMHDYYGNYSESKSRYGTSEDSKKSLKYMLNSVEDFFCMLMEDVNSNEEMQMIKETARRISDM